MNAALTPVKTGRINYLDLTRVLAALLVVLTHLPMGESAEGALWRALFLGGRVPYFFLLAGLFAHQSYNQSYLARLVQLGVPLLLWESVLVFIYTSQGVLYHGGSWADFSLFSQEQLLNHPKNTPLWFLRDLFVITCAAPLLYRLGKASFWLGLSLITLLSVNSIPSSWGACSTLHAWIGGLGFYLIGQSIKQGEALPAIHAHIRNNWAWWAGTSIALSFIVYFTGAPYKILHVPFISIIGVMGLVSTAAGIDHYLPRLSLFCRKASSATYLCFLAHIPLIVMLKWHIESLRPEWSVAFGCFFAVLCLVLSTFLVKGMRRFTPILLPFVAGVRSKK